MIEPAARRLQPLSSQVRRRGRRNDVALAGRDCWRHRETVLSSARTVRVPIAVGESLLCSGTPVAVPAPPQCRPRCVKMNAAGTRHLVSQGIGRHKWRPRPRGHFVCMPTADDLLERCTASRLLVDHLDGVTHTGSGRRLLTLEHRFRPFEHSPPDEVLERVRQYSRPGSLRSRSVGTIGFRSSPPRSPTKACRLSHRLTRTGPFPCRAHSSSVCPLALGRDRKLRSSSSFADEERVVSLIVQTGPRYLPCRAHSLGSVRSRSLGTVSCRSSS